jgi:hypothetical protein
VLPAAAPDLATCPVDIDDEVRRAVVKVLTSRSLLKTSWPWAPRRDVSAASPRKSSWTWHKNSRIVTNT